MAIIMCPECGKHVSTFAKVCVQCGYPLDVIPKNDLVQNIIQEATIEQLGLSLRSYKALCLANIRTVRDICQYNPVQLADTTKLGKKSLEEIDFCLLKLGVCLSEYGASDSLLDKVAVTKYDWKCERAPKCSVISSFECEYKPYELAKLKRGFMPSCMENKWFCYYESGALNFYRSWSGNLICRILFNQNSNKHIVIKYYTEEKEKEKIDQIDVQLLIRCILDDSWLDW